MIYLRCSLPLSVIFIAVFSLVFSPQSAEAARKRSSKGEFIGVYLGQDTEISGSTRTRIPAVKIRVNFPRGANLRIIETRVVNGVRLKTVRTFMKNGRVRSFTTADGAIIRSSTGRYRLNPNSQTIYAVHTVEDATTGARSRVQEQVRGRGNSLVLTSLNLSSGEFRVFKGR